MDSPFPRIPFQTQLDFLWSELEGPEKKTLEAFQSGGYITPQDYAEAFEKLFERSGGSALDKRKNYALEVFRSMEDPLNPQGLSQNAAIAYNYLLNKGLNPPQASGIVGNLMAESFGSIDPAAYNPSGGGQGALGIAQWRGPRLENLLKFAGMNGEKPMVQTTFGSGVPTAGTIFPQQQQKQGLQGLLQRFMQPNQTTGLTGPENFAQALDALILPEARMGEQIRARGAQRLASGSRNQTIAMLQAKARGGDRIAAQVLAALETKAIDAKTAMATYLSESLKQPISAKDKTKMISDARKEFTGLQRVKDFDKVANAYGRISASVKEPSAAGDLSLIFNYMKMLDPQSVVREGEFAAAAAAGGYGERIAAMVQKLKDGTLLTAAQRADFVDRANKLYTEAESLYDNTRNQYITYATEAGFDDDILPDFRYSGELLKKPTILQVPPRPVEFAGDDAAWVTHWQTATEQYRKEYLEALNG